MHHGQVCPQTSNRASAPSELSRTCLIPQPAVDSPGLRNCGCGCAWFRHSLMDLVSGFWLFCLLLRMYSSYNLYRILSWLYGQPVRRRLADCVRSVSGHPTVEFASPPPPIRVNDVHSPREADGSSTWLEHTGGARSAPRQAPPPPTQPPRRPLHHAPPRAPGTAPRRAFPATLSHPPSLFPESRARPADVLLCMVCHRSRTTPHPRRMARPSAPRGPPPPRGRDCTAPAARATASRARAGLQPHTARAERDRPPPASLEIAACEPAAREATRVAPRSPERVP